MIGQFGSGNKDGFAVCFRNNVAPVLLVETVRLDFLCKHSTVADRRG